MRIRTRFRFAAAGIALALLAGTARGSSNDAAWIEDVSYLGQELPRLHVNAFTRVSRATFDDAIRDLIADVPALENYEIVVRMMRVVAMIGDGHTTISTPEFTRFPIGLYWFSDGLVVIQSDEENRDLIGSRLIAIDTRPIDDVVSTIAGIISHENEYWVRERVPSLLTAAESLHALHVVPVLGTASFRFELRDGTTIDRTLHARPAATIQWIDPLAGMEKPLSQRNPQLNYWYSYEESSRTLYVQYNRCREDPSRPLGAFGAELGELARSRPVARLVLDVRYNPGGDSRVIEALLGDLRYSAPYLDDANRFFVAIGQATFSSAMANAVQLDRQTQATLIGQPTGGKPNSFGNVQRFQLPKSRLAVWYTTRYFTFIPHADPPALMPEIFVETSSSDYLAGRDPVMERITMRPPRRRSARH